MRNLALALMLTLLPLQAHAGCGGYFLRMSDFVSTTRFKSRFTTDQRRLTSLASMDKRSKQKLLFSLIDTRKSADALRLPSPWIVRIAVQLSLEDRGDREVAKAVANYFAEIMRIDTEPNLSIAEQVERLVMEFPVSKDRDTNTIFDLAYDYYELLWDGPPAYRESEEFVLKVVSIMRIVAVRSKKTVPDRFHFLNTFLAILATRPTLTPKALERIHEAQRELIAEPAPAPKSRQGISLLERLRSISPD